jgi:hypothetical protein
MIVFGEVMLRSMGASPRRLRRIGSRESGRSFELINTFSTEELRAAAQAPSSLGRRA